MDHADKLEIGLRMAEQNVIAVFDKLLAEIDERIASLNAEGAQLFSEGKYDQARALLNKVESIIAFRGKVICQKDEWKTLNVPDAPKRSSTEGETKRAGLKPRPVKRGSGTSAAEFRYPILEALTRVGGSGSVGEVLGIVGEIMAKELNIYDFHPLPSDPDSVRWKSTAHWERYDMVQEGLLASDSPHGTWEITEAGQEALQQAKDNPNNQRKLFSGQ